ncbi:MAG: diguanylate cyclase (GGDEF)-like protein [Glaciecola sp.]|jgi:diguanylate cyclase (GGDEF)-like protein
MNKLNTVITLLITSLRLTVCAMCVCVFTIHAGQDNIRFETIGLEQGLSQQNVRAIHQDSEGYMWFGTQEGLNRFDGYQFKVFSNSLTDPDSIGSSWINSIDETSDGKLWLATRAGISVFDKSNQIFKRYKALVGADGQTINDANVVFVDSLDNVWVGTKNGLNLYNPQKDTFEHIELEGIKTDKPIRIDSIAEDITNGVWIAAQNYGLFRFDTISQRVERFADIFDHLDEKIAEQTHKVMVDSDQRLWVGTFDKGVFVLDLKMPKQKNNPNSLTKLDGPDDVKVMALYQDSSKITWVGTESGLYSYDKNKKFIEVLRYDIGNVQSIADNKVSSIYQDKGGVFWVGTYRGLSKWNTATANFDYYRYQPNISKSLSNPSINTIFDGGNDTVWVGTNDGLNLIDIESGLITQFKADPDNEDTIPGNNITALFAENKSELWVGVRGKGVTQIDRKTGNHSHYKTIKGDPTSLSSNQVTSIFGTESDDIWVGTYGGGLNRFNKETGKFRRYVHNPDNSFSLSSNNVMSIYEDSRQMLWIGTWDGGVNLFNPALGTSKRIMNAEDDMYSLGSKLVWAVHEDKKGNIWIGTGDAGLNFLSVANRQSGNYNFERISREQGLPSSAVFSILDDQSGKLWLSTNRGLTKFDPETRQMLNYDSSHGLQGNEFNSGAYHKMPDGKFLFGGTNGVTAFYPGDIEPNKHIPPVVVTNFQRLNEVTSMNSLKDQQNRITVSYKDYLIAFEFAGLDFASPDNNRYAYKLEGFDSDWVEARDVRKATYTNLPAGNFVFKVKASNNDGVWNEKGAGIILTVLPAPWFSWWAYTLYTLMFLALAFWFFRSYLNKLKQEETYRLELENEVQKRTVQLSAANEQLLSASVTDQLTGLHNRRYLANVIKEKCIVVSDEFKTHLSKQASDVYEGPRLFFLMFDLDGFKPINDTYGHDAGDKVIIQVGELLQSVCREDDIVVRWGGDEFIVVGKVYEKGEVSALAERIRNTIAKYGFNIGLSQRMHLSSSIGYAMYPFAHFSPDSLSWEQVHLLADKALYRAKDSGRNTWCGLVQPLVAPPVGVMNTLTHNLEHAVEQQYVIVETPLSMQLNQTVQPKIATLIDRR